MKSYRYVPISFILNGEQVSLEVAADDTALRVIRDVLKLKGTKEGCGIGECGACTILVDRKNVNACLMPAPQLQGREVLTVECMERDPVLRTIGESFLEHHGVQCGFCTPGLLMSSHALLKENPDPDRGEVVDGISGNLCRCTGYRQIIDSIEAAAERLHREKE